MYKLKLIAGDIRTNELVVIYHNHNEQKIPHNNMVDIYYIREKYTKVLIKKGYVILDLIGVISSETNIPVWVEDVA